MTRIYRIALATLTILFLYGCARAGIPVEEYSALSTPEETYQFAKRAVASDDPEALYYCLGTSTKQQVSLDEIKFGWTFASGFFYLFLDSHLKESEGVQIPAPEPRFRNNPNTAKLTIQSHRLEASFLLYREEGKWKLILPSPYPMPDIQSLRRKQGIPWRTAQNYHYQTDAQEWWDKKECFYPQKKTWKRQPTWRTATHPQ